MAPMTRSFSPNGIPGDNVAKYHERLTAGEVRLILSEGTVINRPSSSNDNNVPRFYSAASLSGWQKIINDVHADGGQMGPQICHTGIMENHAAGIV